MKRGGPPPPAPKPNITPGVHHHVEEEEEKPYQLKFKEPNYIDRPSSSNEPLEVKLNHWSGGKGNHDIPEAEPIHQVKFKPINFLDKPAEPEGIQIKLRPVDHGANETDTGDAPMAGSPAAGGMKRGTPPPPPGALALTPSQQKQKAIVHVPKAEVSLSDELANAVRNARTGLRKVTPPEEKNYALEEKISVTPFSHFAKNLEEHTVTSEDIKEKLQQAEVAKQEALTAPIEEVFAYSVLKNPDTRPAHCVPERLHLYLSDKEFTEIFKMGKEAFAKLPAWKQVNQRKAANLF